MPFPSHSDMPRTVPVVLATIPGTRTGRDLTRRHVTPGPLLPPSRPAVPALASLPGRGSQPAPPGDHSGLWLRNAAAGLCVLATAAARSGPAR